MTASTTGREIDPAGVDHPVHYNAHPSGVECIELIHRLNFNIGSAVKYVMRRGEKGDAKKDLGKALWYLEDWLYIDRDVPIHKRTVRPTSLGFGDVGSTYEWTKVITTEPVQAARKFYLSIMLEDAGGAMAAVRAMLADEGADQ